MWEILPHACGYDHRMIAVRFSFFNVYSSLQGSRGRFRGIATNGKDVNLTRKRAPSVLPSPIYLLRSGTPMHQLLTTAQAKLNLRLRLTTSCTVNNFKPRNGTWLLLLA